MDPCGQVTGGEIQTVTARLLTSSSSTKPPDRSLLSSADIRSFDRRWRLENIMDDDYGRVRRSHKMMFSREPFTLALRRSKGAATAWCVTVRYEGQILAMRVKVRIRVLPAAAADGGEGTGRGHEAELDDVMIGAARVSEQGVQINRAVGFEKFLHVKDVGGLIERYSSDDNNNDGGDGAITIEAIVEVKAFYETLDAVR